MTPIWESQGFPVYIAERALVAAAELSSGWFSRVLASPSCDCLFTSFGSCHNVDGCQIWNAKND